MFCKKCGTKLPEGAKFCDRCGSATQEAPVPVQQPDVNPVPEIQLPVTAPAQQAAPKKPLSKMKYMYTSGGAISWTAFVVLILATALIGFCLYSTLYGSVFEIPTVQLLDSMTGGSMQELERYFDQGESITAEAEKLLEELKVEYAHGTPEQQKILSTAEDFVENVGQFYDERSIMAIYALLSQISENEDWIELWDEAQQRGVTQRQQAGAVLSAGGYGSNGLQADAKEYTEVLDLAIPVIICCFALCMLLTFLAGLFRNTVLTVFGMIFSVFICMLLSGVVLSLVILALHIAGIVLNTIAGNKFRRAQKLHMAH